MKEVSDQNEILELKAGDEGAFLLDENSTDERTIAIVFAPAGGAVHHIAKRIKKAIKKRPVAMFHVTDLSPEDLRSYRYQIWVSSTIGAEYWQGETQNEWSTFMSKIPDDFLTNRIISLVGLGNSVDYPNNFADGLRWFYDRIKEFGAEVVGKCTTDGYQFIDSRAVVDNLFVGLPLDEDNEADLSDERIAKWIEMQKY